MGVLGWALFVSAPPWGLRLKLQTDSWDCGRKYLFLCWDLASTLEEFSSCHSESSPRGGGRQRTLQMSGNGSHVEGDCQGLYTDDAASKCWCGASDGLDRFLTISIGRHVSLTPRVKNSDAAQPVCGNPLCLVASLLDECSQAVASLLDECSQAVASLLDGCLQAVASLLDGRLQAVASLLDGRLQASTQL